MPRSCTAFNCTSKQLDDFTVSFHRFPKDEKFKTLWILETKRKNFNPSNSTALCSKHFANDDFEVGGIIRKLKIHVIPTIFYFPSHMTPPPPKLKRTRTSDITQYGPINEEAILHSVRLPTSVIRPEPSSSSTLIPVANGVTSRLPCTPKKSKLRRKVKILQQRLHRREKKIKSLKDNVVYT